MAKKNKNTVAIGCIIFCGDPQILIIANEDGYKNFSKFLLDISANVSIIEHSLTKNQLFKITDIDLKILICNKSEGVQTVDSNSYVWKLTRDKLEKFSQTIKELSNTQVSSTKKSIHMYLDSDTKEEIEVKATLNEYPLDFLEKFNCG
jgi:hypothetical protein